MDITQIEINKHKTNIINLAMKLCNTFIINEEIFINNEIKKETEILQSLLNIKNQQNMPLLMNPMIQQQMMQPQMEQQMLQQQFQQQMMMQQQMINKPLEYEKGWNLIFEDKFKYIVTVTINEQKLVKEAISLYKLKSGKTDNIIKFIFNSHELNPEMKICQAGLSDHCKIYVLENDLNGG